MAGTKEQLENIEKNLKSFSTKLSSFKNLPEQLASTITESGIPSEKFEKLENIDSSLHTLKDHR